MNKTKIEWVKNPDGAQGYVWNPVIGCKRGCSYCYAKKINNRFKYIKDFSKPEWRPSSFHKPMPKEPSRIFVNSMSDICYWEKSWLKIVLSTIIDYPQHTFIFLTKDESVYEKYNFPVNCWLGVTQTHGYITQRWINKGNINFISIEPFLNPAILGFLVRNACNWIIIGGLTPKAVHKKVWVDDIIEEARENKIPLFLKNNLHYTKKIQEFPNER